LELKAAYRLEAAYMKLRLDKRPPFRQILLRPAIEPILLSFAETLMEANLQPDAIDRFISCVHGAPVTRRTTDCRITPNEFGNCVLFPPPEHAAEYVSRLSGQLPSIDGPINRVGYAYAEIILSHPYMDGNGRLARSMVLACLAKELGSKLPLIPLAPAFYASAQRTADALQTLAVTADWPFYMQAFKALLTDALQLGERMLFSPAREFD
jgi:hypothetical protein